MVFFNWIKENIIILDNLKCCVKIKIECFGMVIILYFVDIYFFLKRLMWKYFF